MNLQEMLGEAYHEGMSIEEINTALSGKKFADLSTGAYVDKNKYNADLQAKDNELQKKAQALSEKMSADEKKAAAEAEKDALIQQLQDTIKNQNISTNRSKAESLTSEMKNILSIEGNDTSYGQFLDVLSNIETGSASDVASYVNKLVKDSYEKGKKDATKDSLGNFSNGVGKQGSPKQDEVGAFGKQLAEASGKSSTDPNLYFQKK